MNDKLFKIGCFHSYIEDKSLQTHFAQCPLAFLRCVRFWRQSARVCASSLSAQPLNKPIAHQSSHRNMPATAAAASAAIAAAAAESDADAAAAAPPPYATKGGASDKEFELSSVLRYFLGVPGPSGLGSGATADAAAARWDGSGMTAIVTGASGGIGAETARALALRGCHVVLAARDTGKAGRVAEAIRAAAAAGAGGRPASVEVLHLDLSSLASVRAFAAAFLSGGGAGAGAGAAGGASAGAGGLRPLHILVANAGTVFAPLSLSADGHESAFATNHLGHFLLVELLTPALAAGAAARGGSPSRVVLVSSEGHRHPYPAAAGGPVRFAALNDADGFSQLAGYAQSKLCNLLHARELDRRARAARQPILAAAVHPGVVPTEADRHLPLPPLLKRLLRAAFARLIKTVPQGAATSVHAATAPGVEGGEYYADCNLAPSSVTSHDGRLGLRLWAYSERLIAAAAEGAEGQRAGAAS